MLIELAYGQRRCDAPATPPRFEGLRALVFESVGPVRHEVSIPFHDSQVRGAALLIQTGWERHWGAETYWEAGPFLGSHLIFRMVRAGVRLVGVDFPEAGRSSETRLIMAGPIPIVENLRGLAELPHVGARFTVRPLDTGSVCAAYAFAEII